MDASGKSQPSPPEGPGPVRPVWQGVLNRAAIWVLFLVILYLARDFFFLAFLTFMFSYLTLAVVGWGMQRLSRDRERPWLRRLLTVAVFMTVPLALLGIGSLVAPQLLAQGQRLAGWLSQVSPETEVTRVLEGYVGPSEFKRAYGGPDDERYQKGLEEFRKSGVLHVRAYNDYPSLEAWVEGSFSNQFAEAERGRIRHRLAREGTSSREFEHWLLTVKLPQLPEGRPSGSKDQQVKVTSPAKPEQLLEQVRREPATLATLRQEWLQDTLEQGVAQAKEASAYREQLRAHYHELRQRQPEAVPYTLEQYLVLQKVRPQGRIAFGKAVEMMKLPANPETDATARADFEAAKEHELFQAWWGTSSTAKFIRQQVEGGFSEGGAARVQRLLASLINVPLDIATALLLSFFICIDFPNMRAAVGRLRETWLREVYDEIAPALSNLGQLIGRAMHAQGLIALCNATMIFIALTILGVEHEVLLSGATFVLCLVPTLGAVIAWVLIAAFALLQPGGGPALALKASAAVVFVLLMESLVLSPRILGRMMELHPVLIIAILPVAQYFFGIWGLILAMPVAVYVIHVVILRRGLPGSGRT